MGRVGVGEGTWAEAIDEPAEGLEDGEAADFEEEVRLFDGELVDLESPESEALGGMEVESYGLSGGAEGPGEPERGGKEDGEEGESEGQTEAAEALDGALPRGRFGGGVGGGLLGHDRCRFALRRGCRSEGWPATNKRDTNERDGWAQGLRRRGRCARQWGGRGSALKPGSFGLRSGS